jgi:lipopolysaccharide/colanic/teichoic acid biosynthesis glycosyltransferase
MFKKSNLYTAFFKRTFDIIFSLIAVIALLPIYLILFAFVRLLMGKPVLYTQIRPGLNEQPFKIYKFRSMTNKKDIHGNLLPDDKRLTKFGKFLRKSSLDELPELYNILKGDMSFVGPRPQLFKDLIFMSIEQRKRHKVRPGLTGLSQVSGRNNLDWEKKFSLDLRYIEKISFARDLRILFKTFFAVIIGKDTSTDGFQTAEDFGDYLLRLGLISEVEYETKLDELKRTVN